MPNPAILDVAIGIAFVYLFLSLICSVVNEAIATLLSLRAKNLVEGISSLFSESRIADGRQFVEALYAHGLIRGLYKNPSAVEVPATPPPNLVLPPDMPAPAINKPLVEIAAHLPSVLSLVNKWVKVNLPAYIPSATFSAALIDVIAPPDPSRARDLGDVRVAIAKLPPSPTQQALLSLVASTQQDITEFAGRVEGWFNDSMDRAADRYKRRTQVILFTIGVVVTLMLNVDTIKLAQSLWNNPIEREATVELAQKYVSANQQPPSSVQDFTAQANQIAQIGQQLPFPFGWSGWSPKGKLFWVESFLGWFITALALSLGAPFWFDTLNKFMQVRSAVRPKERRPDDDNG